MTLTKTLVLLAAVATVAACAKKEEPMAPVVVAPVETMDSSDGLPK